MWASERVRRDRKRRDNWATARHLPPTRCSAPTQHECDVGTETEWSVPVCPPSRGGEAHPDRHVESTPPSTPRARPRREHAASTPRRAPWSTPPLRPPCLQIMALTKLYRAVIVSRQRALAVGLTARRLAPPSGLAGCRPNAGLMRLLAGREQRSVQARTHPVTFQGGVQPVPKQPADAREPHRAAQHGGGILQSRNFASSSLYVHTYKQTCIVCNK